jgi:hypothetical protein
MCRFRGRPTVQKIQCEVRNPDIMMDQLRTVLSQVVKKNVVVFEPPNHIKYNTTFLSKYQTLKAYGPTCPNSQEPMVTQPTGTEVVDDNNDDNNDATIVPTSIFNTPHAALVAKKPT